MGGSTIGATNGTRRMTNLATKKATQAGAWVNAWLYRRTNGRVGGRGMGRVPLLLTVSGRKTGTPRTVPVGYLIATDSTSSLAPGWAAQGVFQIGSLTSTRRAAAVPRSALRRTTSPRAVTGRSETNY